MNTQKGLRQSLKYLEALPAIPVIAQKILALKIATDEGEKALLELIKKEPSILSKIIGLANSPLFGMGREILTLQEAVTLLGNKRVKMVALSFAMMSSLARKPGGVLDTQIMWRHSLAFAMTMASLAQYMPKNRCPADGEIYLAGLLHNIGYIVLDCIAPELSDQFHSRLLAEPDRSRDEIEAEMLEINHYELGAELARHWNLPKSIIAALRYHHLPHTEPAAIGQPLVAMVNLAEKLLPRLEIVESEPLEITRSEWNFLEIDPENEIEIKACIANHIREVTDIYT